MTPGAWRSRTASNLERNKELRSEHSRTLLGRIGLSVATTGPIKAAAKQLLKGEAAKRFAGSQLRSAMTTHELEQGKNIIGIQYRVGHKLLSSTSRYVKPSFRAARDVLNLGLPPERNPKRKTA